MAVDAHTVRVNAIRRLVERRKAVQKAYDDLIGQPSSYGITGSVNATNQRLVDLRAELVAIDEQIASIAGRNPAGMSIRLPDYRLLEV